MRAGADGYIASTDAAQMAEHTGVFDLILNTVPSNRRRSRPACAQRRQAGPYRLRQRPAGLSTSSCLAVPRACGVYRRHRLHAGGDGPLRRRGS